MATKFGLRTRWNMARSWRYTTLRQKMPSATRSQVGTASSSRRCRPRILSTMRCLLMELAVSTLILIASKPSMTAQAANCRKCSEAWMCWGWRTARRGRCSGDGAKDLWIHGTTESRIESYRTCHYWMGGKCGSFMKTLHLDLAKGKWLCASSRVIICLKARDGLPLGPFLNEVTKRPVWAALMPHFRLTNVPIKPIYNYLIIVNLWCLLWCPQ